MGHLKHGHVLSAFKNSFERIISINQRFFLCASSLFFLILITVPFGHFFGMWKRLQSYDLDKQIIAERVSSEVRSFCERFLLLA